MCACLYHRLVVFLFLLRVLSLTLNNKKFITTILNVVVDDKNKKMIDDVAGFAEINDSKEFDIYYKDTFVFIVKK